MIRRGAFGDLRIDVFERAARRIGSDLPEESVRNGLREGGTGTPPCMPTRPCDCPQTTDRRMGFLADRSPAILRLPTAVNFLRRA